MRPRARGRRRRAVDRAPSARAASRRVRRGVEPASRPRPGRGVHLRPRLGRTPALRHSPARAGPAAVARRRHSPSPTCPGRTAEQRPAQPGRPRPTDGLGEAPAPGVGAGAGAGLVTGATTGAGAGADDRRRDGGGGGTPHAEAGASPGRRSRPPRTRPGCRGGRREPAIRRRRCRRRSPPHRPRRPLRPFDGDLAEVREGDGVAVELDRHGTTRGRDDTRERDGARAGARTDSPRPRRRRSRCAGRRRTRRGRASRDGARRRAAATSRPMPAGRGQVLRGPPTPAKRRTTHLLFSHLTTMRRTVVGPSDVVNYAYTQAKSELEKCGSRASGRRARCGSPR